jgi:putative Holliday junction resolvase
MIFTGSAPWRVGVLQAAEYKAAGPDNKYHDRVTMRAAAKGEGRDEPATIERFADALTRGVRLIGIDVGTKTLGLALSDVTRTIASGLTTLARTKFTADAARLLALAEEHGVGGFVVGLPVSLDGSEGPRAQATRAFSRNLSKLTTLPMLHWDERLSTAAAERALLEADTSRRRRAEVIDKVAATLILQGALDRLKSLEASRAASR